MNFKKYSVTIRTEKYGKLDEEIIETETLKGDDDSLLAQCETLVEWQEHYGDKVKRVLVRDCETKEIVLRRNESGEWIFLAA